MHYCLQVREPPELPEDGDELEPDSVYDKGGIRVRIAEVGGG